ncbi:MAG: CsgG/HfaB family protein [Acidobacteriota bacterium]|nr:CsgG/HfaB family protein [Acidobacteriota bacterium]
MSALRTSALLIASAAVALPALAQSGLRYTVSVTEFENRAGWHGQWDLGDAWGVVMTDKLQQSGKFIVLGEGDMRGAALAEQDLGASGRTAQGAKTPVTGQLTPAQILVKGAVTHVQGSTEGGGGGIRIRGLKLGGKKGKAEMNATIYMVDSTTGQILASTSVVGAAKRKGAGVSYSGSNFGTGFNAYQNDNVGRAMEDAIDQAVVWLAEQIDDVPWTGSVAMVRDGQVYINRGERDGVSAGQTFVVGSADIIRDPDTGEVLDTFVNELARLEATTVREKLTICNVVSGSAGAVEKGMTVQLP